MGKTNFCFDKRPVNGCITKHITGTEKFHHPPGKLPTTTRIGRKRKRRNIHGDIENYLRVEQILYIPHPFFFISAIKSFNESSSAENNFRWQKGQL